DRRHDGRFFGSDSWLRLALRLGCRFLRFRLFGFRLRLGLGLGLAGFKFSGFRFGLWQLDWFLNFFDDDRRWGFDGNRLGFGLDRRSDLGLGGRWRRFVLLAGDTVEELFEETAHDRELAPLMRPVS